jgi:hypothetical protein
MNPNKFASWGRNRTTPVVPLRLLQTPLEEPAEPVSETPTPNDADALQAVSMTSESAPERVR